MRLLAVLVAVVAICLVGTARADKESDVKEEMKKLAGTWVAVEEEKDGKTLPSKGLNAPTLTLKGNGQYQYQDGNQKQQGTYKLDPTQNPGQIDLIPDKKDDGMRPCIYQQKGDQVQICLPPPGKDRPKQFTTQQGTGNQCITYKRK